MMMVTPDSAFHLPARPCEIFDVSGAGDTVIALLASGLITGLSLEAGYCCQSWRVTGRSKIWYRLSGSR